MTDEEKDLIQRVQDIQRYTENRCNTLEEKIAKLEKENEQLKQQIEKKKCCSTCSYYTYCGIDRELAGLKSQIEKMKNFYNCKNSSRALCPNEHNCKGCKEWELAE